MPMAVIKSKKPTPIERINTRLMEENISLKADIGNQLTLIEKMRSRKDKAYRRLKALRELGKHVEMLQGENRWLRAENMNLRLIKVNFRPSFFERLFGG